MPWFEFAFAVYIAFFIGLALLARLAVPRLSRRWQLAIAGLWTIIVVGHAVFFLGDDINTKLVVAPILIIGGVVGHAVPFRKAAPTMSYRIGQWLGLSAFVLLTVFLEYLASTHPDPGSRRFMASIPLVGLIGTTLAWLRIGAGVMLVGVLLFALSIAGFMTIGIAVLPTALMFIGSSLTLIAAGETANADGDLAPN